MESDGHAGLRRRGAPLPRRARGEGPRPHRRHLGRGRRLDGVLQQLPPEEEQEFVRRARDWQRVRYENGFGWITGPAEYGGAGLTPVHDLALRRLEAEYDVPDTGVLSVIGLGMIGPTILAHAQPAVRERYLPAMYRGDDHRLPAVQRARRGVRPRGVATRAVRDGDDWVLNGQKVWTSVAQHADIGLALCRTNPDAPKHQRHHRLPGRHGRPRRRGPAAAADDRRRRLQRGLPHRRRSPRRPPARRGRRRLAGRADHPDERARHRRRRGHRAGGRRALPGFLVGAHARQLDLQTTAPCAPASPNSCVDVHGHRIPQPPGPAPAARREHPGPGGVRLQADVRAEPHPRRPTSPPRCSAPAWSPTPAQWGTFAWSELLLSAPALRILGGTEEIMKNILAERVLGLPKEPGTHRCRGAAP